MRLKFSVISVSVILSIILQTNLRAEYIFLKDGQIKQGEITSETADTVVLKGIDKKTAAIKRDVILRILYTEIYLGKVFVQKNDGKNIVCYMVNEDRETYTFRLDLYKNDEFILQREEVLFIARGNPSGLSMTSDPEFETVAVKWFPPYNQVKVYRVYVKSESDANFVLNGETKSKEYVIKNLKSNAKYVAVVKAVDEANDESQPSNEIKFLTKNRAPLPPENAKFENTSKKDGTVKYKINWNAAVDTDGKVTGYKIYKIFKGETSFSADVKKTEFVFADNEDADAVEVISVDELGAESKKKVIYIKARKEFSVGVSPAVMFPLSDLRKLSEIAYGAVINGAFSNYFFDNFEFGFTWGIYNLVGKESYLEPESSLNMVIISPLTLNAGYAFHPISQLRVTPALHAGTCFVYMNYNHFDMISSSEKAVTGFEIVPAAGLSLEMRYDINDDFFVDVLSNVMFIFEKETTLSFCAVSAGGGMRF